MDFKNKIIKEIHHTKSIVKIQLSKKRSKDNNVKDFIQQTNNILDKKSKKIIDQCSMGIVIETPVEHMIRSTGACC